MHIHILCGYAKTQESFCLGIYAWEYILPRWMFQFLLLFEEEKKVGKKGNRNKKKKKKENCLYLTSWNGIIYSNKQYIWRVTEQSSIQGEWRWSLYGREFIKQRSLDFASQ